MAEPQVYTTVWNEDGTAYVLARVMRKNSSHSMVVPASSDVSSITRAVYSMPSSTVVLASTTLTTSDVLLTALSTGDVWTVDATGFNFVDIVPATAFPTANQDIKVEYKWTLTDSTVFPLAVRGPVLGIEGS